MKSPLRASVLALLALSAACGPMRMPLTPDASSDASADRSMADAVVDVARPDASADAEREAAVDAGVDARGDVVADVVREASADVVAEAGPDAGPDVMALPDVIAPDVAPPGDGGSGSGGYTQTTIPVACDTMTGATVASEIIDDDTAGEARALPFAFQYYGGSMTHYAMTTNGSAQLFSSAPDPSDVYDGLGNDVLPDEFQPPNLLGVWWSDLEVNSPAFVHFATLGTGTARRLVVEWNHVNTLATADDLTFQLKLFEATNVIEFHYCSMSSSDGSEYYSGELVTVGMQNSDGSDGITVFNDAPGTITSSGAYRFAPR